MAVSTFSPILLLSQTEHPFFINAEAQLWSNAYNELLTRFEYLARILKKEREENAKSRQAAAEVKQKIADLQAKLERSRQRNALSKGGSAVHLEDWGAYNVEKGGRREDMDVNVDKTF